MNGNWELGGDSEYTSAGVSRFKLPAIANRAGYVTSPERFSLLRDGSEQKNLFLNTNAITEERILRGSDTVDVRENPDIAIGLERTQNVLDASLATELLDDEGGSSAAFGTLFGALVLQSVKIVNSKVEEIAYQLFNIHNLIDNPKLPLVITLL